MVDSAVYLCFSFALSALVFATYALIESFGIAIVPQVGISFWIWLVFASAVSAYTVYRLSLHAHAQFGEMWRSIFDVYHDKIDLKIDDALQEWTHKSLLEHADRRSCNKIIWRFLHNYRIKCPSTGEILKTPDYKHRIEKAVR